jgi:hypothetical protein
VLANLNIDKQGAMDRYNQHVKYCTSCRTALENTNKTAAGAAAAACAAFIAAGLVAAVRAQIAAAGSAAAAGVPEWVAGALGSGVLGATVPLVVVGVVALLVSLAARQLKQFFYYKDWKRPAF